MANLSLGIDIGGGRKFEQYDLFIEMPTPLVPRRLRRDIPERLGEAGAVEILLEESALVRVTEEFSADGVGSVAVTYLLSYTNPAHERIAARLLARDYPPVDAGRRQWRPGVAGCRRACERPGRRLRDQRGRVRRLKCPSPCRL